MTQRALQKAAWSAEKVLVTPDRCPQCGAALPPAASWCSLCFHDLTVDPSPAAVSETEQPSAAAAAEARGYSAQTYVDPLESLESLATAYAEPRPDGLESPATAYDEPLAQPSRLHEASMLEPDAQAVLTGAAATATLAERPAGWPCAGCGALVALDLMACSTCGAPFLPRESGVSLPVVGDPRSLSGGMKAAIMGGGAVVVTVVVFVLFVVLGSIF